MSDTIPYASDSIKKPLMICDDCESVLFVMDGVAFIKDGNLVMVCMDCYLKRWADLYRNIFEDFKRRVATQSHE